MEEMPTPPMTVVETPFFVRKAATLLDEDERSGLITFLGMNPDAGDVIPETGGVRKVRWAAKGKGKRGGVRVIYYCHSETYPLFLLTVYAKNQQANLTKAERNEFKELVPLLVKTYARARKL
jgi:mRNA-degrading endonuclease RelE of RelBE toxin-antitoxin system